MFGIRQSARLRLTALDARLCPAVTLQSAAGNLVITGTPTSTLTVTGTGGSKFQVTDGASNFGTYIITNDLKLNLARYTANITVDLNGGTIPGNVSITSTIGTTGTATITVVDGTVGGALIDSGGIGSERLQVGEFAGTATTIGGGIRFTGKNAGSPVQGESFVVFDGSVINGGVLLTAVDNFSIGTIGGAGAKVNGGLIVNDAGSPLELAGLITGASTVTGNVTLVGTAAFNKSGDAVSVDAGATVNGDVVASFGDSVNYLVIDGTVAGNVGFTGGTGPTGTGFPTNEVDVNGTIFGNLSINVRGGDNAVVFTGTVFGGMIYTGGTGEDDLGGGTQGGTFTGTVGGRVSWSLGNGANYFTLDGTVFGDRLTYTGGSGEDSVTINSANAFALNANLGVGADVFTYGATASVGSATIDFGVDSDLDTYNDSGVFVSWPPTTAAFS